MTEELEEAIEEEEAAEDVWEELVELEDDEAWEEEEASKDALREAVLATLEEEDEAELPGLIPKRCIHWA